MRSAYFGPLKKASLTLPSQQNWDDPTGLLQPHNKQGNILLCSSSPNMFVFWSQNVISELPEADQPRRRHGNGATLSAAVRRPVSHLWRVELMGLISGLDPASAPRQEDQMHHGKRLIVVTSPLGFSANEQA